MRIYRRIGFQPVRGALTDRLEAYPTGKNLSAARLIPPAAEKSRERPSRKFGRELFLAPDRPTDTMKWPRRSVRAAPPFYSTLPLTRRTFDVRTIAEALPVWNACQ